MRDSLHRFGLTEFLATVCPGAFLLVLSVFVWVPLTRYKDFPKDTIPEPFLWAAAVLLLLIAYAVGLILSAWAAAGARSFSYHGDAPVEAPLETWPRLIYLWFWHWCHNPFAAQPAFPEAMLAMCQHTLAGIRSEELVQPGTPQEIAALFRLTETGRAGPALEPLILEADAAGSKRLFSLGVAHAFLISGVQAVIAIFVHSIQPHLIITALLTIVLSFLLRYVAGVLWEQEFRLTCLVLSRRDPTPVSAGSPAHAHPSTGNPALHTGT